MTNKERNPSCTVKKIEPQRSDLLGRNWKEFMLKDNNIFWRKTRRKADA